MFRVDWLESALNELATIWLDADTEQRLAINSAVRLIDQELQRDPLGYG